MWTSLVRDSEVSKRYAGMLEVGSANRGLNTFIMVDTQRIQRKSCWSKVMKLNKFAAN